MQALTLGTGGGTPARNATAGASGQAVVRGEWQSTDVAAELDWRLQLQKHDIMVVVQVGGADLVFRMGDRADHLHCLLAVLHTPQGMLA